MNAWRIAIGMLAVAVGLAACGGKDGEGRAGPSTPDTDAADTAARDEGTASPTSRTAAAALIGRRWVLAGAIPGRGTIKAGFELREDGTLVGHTGVNRANGTYELTGKAGIHIPPLATTRMAGPPEAMDREQLLLGALAKADAWRVLDGDLELLADGEVVLRLVKERKP